MPILGSFGAGSKGGYGRAVKGFVCASGGTVITQGDYKTHIFTGPGSFVVNKGGKVDYLVVAGGGSSAYSFAGGGGAGGFRISNELGLPAPTTSPLANSTGISVPAATYPITVGGGASFTPGTGAGNNGSPSIFSSITSAGGGWGGQGASCCATQRTGGAGGSGGGSGGPYPTGAGPAGAAGNTPPTVPPQGNDGGAGWTYGTGQENGHRQGGGGGGAGASGGNTSPGTGGGTGGVGSYIDDTFIGPTAPSYGTPGPVGSTRYFSGGGGGMTFTGNCQSQGGIGGAGGGGNGAKYAPFQGATPQGGQNGTTNTGGGAGGIYSFSTSPVAGTGGSGIVMIRYRFQQS